MKRTYLDVRYDVTDLTEDERADLAGEAQMIAESVAQELDGDDEDVTRAGHPDVAVEIEWNDVEVESPFLRQTTSIQPPAPAPCGSCPYRLDVPSGVWAEEEYAKLPGYDLDTAHQPVGVFMCHQQDGRVCAGWAGCHDMGDSLAVRLACAAGYMDEAALDALLDYATDVPLFPSGGAAAEHGLAEVDAPGSAAVQTIKRLRRRRR